MAWDSDKLPLGPALDKPHGRLDVNLEYLRRKLLGKAGPEDAGKVLQVQGDGTVAWVDQHTLATQYNSDVAYNDDTYDYNEL